MELVKDKRRATRRKRNFIARDLRENKLYKPKRIELKRKRERINIREIELHEDYLQDLPVLPSRVLLPVPDKDTTQ